MTNLFFHLVTLSPWPIVLSISILNFLMSILMMCKKFNSYMVIINLMIVTMISLLWWRDVIRESTFQGFHTNKVFWGIQLGMILFIVSEIFFFISFFWSYFNYMLSQSPNLGQDFPPMGINQFNPFNMPLLNTIILLSSGISLTWSHNCMLNNLKNKTINSLLLTIILGIYFSFLQLTEYKHAAFSINDSCFGSTFFLATGFHGIHVMLGTFFLSIMLIRLIINQFSFYHHFGFEGAAWYWHFVDVVWIFLFTFIYWWTF